SIISASSSVFKSSPIASFVLIATNTLSSVKYISGNVAASTSAENVKFFGLSTISFTVASTFSPSSSNLMNPSFSNNAKIRPWSATDRLKITSVPSSISSRRNRSDFKSVGDRKSTRLNSSHVSISYAVFCLKKKKERQQKISRSNRRVRR